MAVIQNDEKQRNTCNNMHEHHNCLKQSTWLIKILVFFIIKYYTQVFYSFLLIKRN